MAWTVPAVSMVFNCRAYTVGLLLFQGRVGVHMCVVRARGGTVQNGSPSPTALPRAASMRASPATRAQSTVRIAHHPTHSSDAFMFRFNIKRSSAGNGVLVIPNNTYA